MNIGILTDFISHDPAYSLCGVVLNQLKMLYGQNVTIFVRADPNNFVDAYGDYAESIVELDPGETGSNKVTVTDKSEQEIESLVRQMDENFNEIDVMLTHDLIYQANMWKYHVAARRYAINSDMKWLHWVHSSTDWNVAGKTKQFRKELKGRMPNSKLIAMHNEEINRKGGLYNYERDQIMVIPNPLDTTEGYHDFSKAILGDDIWRSDCVIVYPARLDRGKQVEVIGEIVDGMISDGWDVRVIIVDFHSTGGDKVKYRDELKERFGHFMKFTHDVMPDTSYRVPHKVVMDLFDYADVFIHPSRSESDPLTVPEAMWKRNLLVLNRDLPIFRQYDGRALFGQFSSNIDVLTGMSGSTETSYDDRKTYMAEIGRAIAYMMQQDMTMINHRLVRQTRSLEAVRWKFLLPAISASHD